SPGWPDTPTAGPCARPGSRRQRPARRAWVRRWTGRCAPGRPVAARRPSVRAVSRRGRGAAGTGLDSWVWSDAEVVHVDGGAAFHRKLFDDGLLQARAQLGVGEG